MNAAEEVALAESLGWKAEDDLRRRGNSQFRKEDQLVWFSPGYFSPACWSRATIVNSVMTNRRDFKSLKDALEAI